MSRHVDLLIVGAGPAGMTAAVAARRHGLNVLVVDEQLTPGGQIWRNVEALAGTPRMDLLGKAYEEGLNVVRQFRASGANYEPGTQVWQVETGHRAYVTRAGSASSIDATYLLLATGAQERPAPFPGWALPGVMTVGAAQIVLKTSDQIPSEPVWIAGSGPLSLLYAAQLLQAGGQIAGFLDTSRPGQLSGVIPDLFAAFRNAPMDIVKGIGWLQSVKRRVQYIKHVTEIEATGKESLEHLRYVTASGQSG
ncbi:NAD(P)/FAD-dependent oxidoreductase, partial [Agrobacterium tumefaciens]|nr:FAD-dependent oxidoreductase [Agrobacterium tumefaciens]